MAKNKPSSKNKQTHNDKSFNDQFTKCIRGELEQDPRGGYSHRDGYRKKPNPGQGPYQGATMWHGLDDIGQGNKK